MPCTTESQWASSEHPDKLDELDEPDELDDELDGELDGELGGEPRDELETSRSDRRPRVWIVRRSSSRN